MRVPPTRVSGGTGPRSRGNVAVNIGARPAAD